MLRGEAESLQGWLHNGDAVRFGRELAVILVGLWVMTVLLIGFAPVAWLFSQSTNSVFWMGFFHLMVWFVATAFGLRFLDSGFRHTNASSGAGLKTWSVIFVLVVLQISTALRPLLGRADTFLPAEKKFFLTHWGYCSQDQGKDAKSNSSR